MWLFTIHGFYSITRSTDEPEKFQIRARSHQHLENLKAHLMGHGLELGGPILITPSADYRFRIIADAATIQILMAELVEDLDYGNFKAAAQENLPEDRLYTASLHRVWSTMRDLQHNGATTTH